MSSPDGFAAECDRVGASVVGGHRTRSDQDRHRRHRDRRVHAVAGAPVRGPAGDVLALAGRQGWSAGGLAVLGRGFRSPRVPGGRLPPPGSAVRRRAGRRRAGATAMIDVSDGLLADAGHLATDSARRHRCTYGPRSRVPEPLVAVGAATQRRPVWSSPGGGEDHALLAAFPDEGSAPAGWTVDR